MTTTTYYGRDELMVIAAVRYCLGRQTYIVSYCADWLIENWERFAPGTKKLIQRDIDAPLDDDDRRAALRLYYRHLGAVCDRAEWERVRRLWQVDTALNEVSDTSEKLGGY